MSEKPSRKETKVGVKRGGGPAPGYRWNVQILDRAYDEARGFLDDDQYEHLRRQVCELARQHDPTHSKSIDVREIEDFHELRDKWGILGRMNVRVFFFVHKPSRAMVILGAINKTNDGPTPMGDKTRMRLRMRRYLESLNPEA